MGKKIADNATAAEMIQIANAARIFLSLGIAPPQGPLSQAAAALADVVDKADVLTLPDRFNTAFSRMGWITCGSMPTDTMERAIDLRKVKRTEEAEALLADIFDEPALRFLIMRSHRFHRAAERKDQLEEAKALFLQGRYLAATPLILMAADGLAYDVGGFSVFSDHADLSAFDSIVGHPTGLPALIQLIRMRRPKTTGESISIPYRHGILHGRDSGYGNKIACAKAWHLLQALVDWAGEKEGEAARIQDRQKKDTMTLEEVIDDAVASAAKREAEKKAIDAWVARDLDHLPSEPREAGSPEETLYDYLCGWRDENFGRMGQRSINFVGYSPGKLAYQARRDARRLKLQDFNVRRFYDTAPGASRAEVTLTFAMPDGVKSLEVEMGIMLDLGKDGIYLRGPQAKWQVLGHALHEARRALGVEYSAD